MGTKRFLEPCVDLVVTQARLGANGGARHPGRDELSSLAKAHDDAHGKPILVWPEGADIGTKALGQHWYDAINQVGRAGSLPCLVVYGAAPAHVVAHVGNVHLDLKATSDPTGANRVVEVARVGRIDGKDTALAKVRASRTHCQGLLYARLNGSRRGEYRLGKLAAQPIRGNDGLDGQVKATFVVRAPLYGNDSRRRTRRILQDARHHHVA